MAKDVTVIGCRLPNGIVLHDPTEPKIKVVLNGLNKSLIKNADGTPAAGITTIPTEFWSKWYEHHSKEPTFPALVSGAIFSCKSVDDAQAMSRELAKERTGFEGMPQEAMGVKKADNKE